MHYTAFVTPDTNLAGDAANWLVSCGKNPGALPNNILVQGVARGNRATSYAGNWQLAINPSEPSDWAAAHALVWDSALTDDEMVQVSSSMLGSLSNSLVNISSLGSTCECTMALPSCNSTSTASQRLCLVCRKCVPGTYSSPACNGCMQCQYGSYTPFAGASACAQCFPGSYGMLPGATACLTCPGAKYAPFLGMTFCLDVSLMCSTLFV